MLLLPNFRLPTLIHSRSANAKWLYEIAHQNPVWVHTLDTGHEKALSDSSAEVNIEVTNSEGVQYAFSNTSPSITRSSIETILDAMEFFINSERAVVSLYKALKHAKENNRPDSVDQYTQMLTILVAATSYSEVIEKVKNTQS